MTNKTKTKWSNLGNSWTESLQKESIKVLTKGIWHGIKTFIRDFTIELPKAMTGSK